MFPATRSSSPLRYAALVGAVAAASWIVLLKACFLPLRFVIGVTKAQLNANNKEQARRK